MAKSPRTPNRYLLHAAASAVVVVSGLYLIVANVLQGHPLAIVVAALQVVAGVFLLAQALRQWRHRRSE